MSAWLCSAKHISILVNALDRTRASNGERDRFIGDFAQKARENAGTVVTTISTDREALFADLLEENVKSLQSRYEHDFESPPQERIWSGADSAVYEPRALPLSVLDAIKLAHSYDYQACEHEGYQGSNAQQFIQALIVRLTHYLPGWDDDEKVRWSA